MATGPTVNATILLVEDDRDLREIVTEILEGAGYKVLTATNGQEGLDCLRALVGDMPNLVLLDLSMPVKDGFDFLSERQNEAALERVPVVAMSADNAIADKLEGFVTHGYLKKPVEIEALLETCARYCQA
jgi:two-component system chemotaxis response regulator CheY